MNAVVISMDSNRIVTLDGYTVSGCRSLPGCCGYRRAVMRDGTIYIAGALHDCVTALSVCGLSVKYHTVCVGRYPVWIGVWHNLLLVACADTDTLECRDLVSGLAVSCLRVGGGVTDAVLENDVCSVICAHERKLVRVKLPEMIVCDEVGLGIMPTGIARCGKAVICGIDTSDSGVIMRDKSFDLIATGRIPLSCCALGSRYFVSCSGEDCVYIHESRTGEVRQRCCIGEMTDRIIPYLGGALVTHQLSPHVSVLSGGRLIKRLRCCDIPSDIVIVKDD